MIIDTEHADIVTVSSVNQENCYPGYVVMWAIVTFSAGHELLMADDIMTQWIGRCDITHNRGLGSIITRDGWGQT